MEDKRLIENLLLVRYLYKIGNPIISDEVYDKEVRKLREQGVALEVLDRLVEDDPIPVDILKDRGLERFIIIPSKSNRIEENLEELLSYKSYSIEPLETIEDVSQYYKQFIGRTARQSLKVNGINARALYKRYNDSYILKVVSSRGRNTDKLHDFTDSMRNVIPTTLSGDITDKDTVVVYFEIVVNSNMLPYLRGLTGKDLKNPRSAALSIAITGAPDLAYRYVHAYVFKALNIKESITESLEILEQQGFELAPGFTREITESDCEYSSITEVVNSFSKISERRDISADGIVVELDDLNSEIKEVNGIYTTNNFAIKLGEWAPQIYMGILRNILAETQKAEVSFIGIIDPVTMSNGNVATKVNLYNPDTIIRNNLKIGEPLYFQFKSESNICLYDKDKEEGLKR